MKNLNKKVKEKFENFFDWIKGATLVELKFCNPDEDPIRPELQMTLEQAMDVKFTV